VSRGIGRLLPGAEGGLGPVRILAPAAGAHRRRALAHTFSPEVVGDG
jgi:hypothetical protein